jgi:hypothetical protein
MATSANGDNMPKSVHLYVRFSPEEKQLIECIKQKLHHSSMSDTIRFLVRLGILQLDSDIKKSCNVSQ